LPPGLGSTNTPPLAEVVGAVEVVGLTEVVGGVEVVGLTEVVGATEVVGKADVVGEVEVVGGGVELVVFEVVVVPPPQPEMLISKMKITAENAKTFLGTTTPFFHPNIHSPLIYPKEYQLCKYSIHRMPYNRK
jgi:hypothetical protein